MQVQTFYISPQVSCLDCEDVHNPMNLQRFLCLLSDQACNNNAVIDECAEIRRVPVMFIDDNVHHCNIHLFVTRTIK